MRKKRYPLNQYLISQKLKNKSIIFFLIKLKKKFRHKKPKKNILVNKREDIIKNFYHNPNIEINKNINKN